MSELPSIEESKQPKDLGFPYPRFDDLDESEEIGKFILAELKSHGKGNSGGAAKEVFRHMTDKFGDKWWEKDPSKIIFLMYSFSWASNRLWSPDRKKK